MRTGSKKSVLIVYHTQSGNTEKLAKAVEQGAVLIQGVRVRIMKAFQVSGEDLMACSALIICSPEYFGYMAGAVKDLFDRTYEEIREQVIGKSYGLVICAGNDGTGALSSIERIIAGYRLKRIQAPVMCRGAVTEADLKACRALGQTIAAGVELGIY